MKIAVIGSRNLTVNDLGQYLPGEVRLTGVEPVTVWHTAFSRLSCAIF